MVRASMEGQLQEYTLRDLIELSIWRASWGQQQTTLEARPARGLLASAYLSWTGALWCWPAWRVLQARSPAQTIPYVLCERQPNWRFFSGFHRHGACGSSGQLHRPTSANPNAITALIGARLLEAITGISRCHQVFITWRRNTSKQQIFHPLFAGFGYAYHARKYRHSCLPCLTLLLRPVS